MVINLSQNKIKRKQKLLDILAEEEIIQLSVLANQLKISEMTARRYAAELDQVHLAGSHIFLRKDKDLSASIYTMDVENDRNIDKKEAVGKAAAALVEENDVIYIDCGTTTPFIAHNINKNLKFKAVCCSLNVFNILSNYENCHILLTGGEYHERTQVFSSRQALDMIRSIRITKAFISAAGIDRKLGLTCFNQYETHLKREVMNYSQHVYIVADSCKINQVKIAYFGDVSQGHTLITNNDLPQDDERWVKAAGLNIIKC